LLVVAVILLVLLPEAYHWMDSHQTLLLLLLVP
jgi:hypothetical protein